MTLPRIPALTLLALTSASAACTGPAAIPAAPAVDLPAFEQPPKFYLLTEGVTIEAEEDSWVLTDGEPVDPPFRSEFWEMEDGVGGMLSEYQAAIDNGAMRVRVTVPSLEEPLYGVLALLPVADTATSIPPKRTYRVLVPENRIQEARGGLISYTYQPYKYTYQCPVYMSASRSYAIQEATSDEVPSWVLWLSDTQF
jgi:hypothetical protein